MEKEVAQLRNFEMKMDRKVIADHRRRSTFTPPTSVRPSVVAASPGTRRLARIAPSFVRRDSWRTWAYWRAWLSRSVHPHSFLPRVLSRAVQVVSVFNCLSVPVRIAFYSSVSVPVYLAVLNALCDICLWAFVFVKSRVAYYFMGELVTDIKLVRRRYLREWALYDLVACFPTEVFVGYRSTPVHRLARILTMRYIFNLSLTSRKMVAVRPITKLALALLQFILFVHFVACSYWILTFIDGFAPDEGLPHGSSGALDGPFRLRPPPVPVFSQRADAQEHSVPADRPAVDGDVRRQVWALRPVQPEVADGAGAGAEPGDGRPARVRHRDDRGGPVRHGAHHQQRGVAGDRHEPVAARPPGQHPERRPVHIVQGMEGAAAAPWPSVLTVVVSPRDSPTRSASGSTG